MPPKPAGLETSPEARGWTASQEMKDVLMAGLKQVGEQLTADRKAGGDGLAVIEAYKKN